MTDVDRAKAFYEKVGVNADHEHKVHEGLRFAQLTPPDVNEQTKTPT
ncbi:hypothetical protein [Micromonospora sp. NPDC004551]